MSKKKTGIKGVGELLTDSPTRETPTGQKHPGRLNLILRKNSYPKGKTRYGEWFGDISEEQIYCSFFGCAPGDSTNVKRDKLFSFIYGVSTGRIQVTVSE